MDYDATDIPAGYDLGRSYDPEVLDLWMNAVSSHVEPQVITSILDLGCGTGRFSEALAARFNAEVIGVDPSHKMLEQARTKRCDRRVQYMRGRAEAIPLPDNSVDMIFMSMIFHHLESPTLAARECRRVLRKKATAFLRSGTREHIPSYTYVDFFPASRSILEQRLPENDAVREVFEAAGFRTVGFEVITQQTARSYAAYVEKIAAGADSVLASLSQRDFEAGLEALRLHATRVEDQAVFEPIDFFVFR